MDAVWSFLQDHHLVCDVFVVTVVVAALHRNYVHRFATIGLGCLALSYVAGEGYPNRLLSVLLVLVAPARTISNPVTHHVYGAVYAPA
jgi:hypothetical protein